MPKLSFLKLTLVFVAVLAIVGVGYALLNMSKEIADDQPLDFIEARPFEEFVEFLNDGEVERIEYPEEYKESLLIGSAQIILKDGHMFVTGPIKHVLQAIEQCGDTCKDTEVISW